MNGIPPRTQNLIRVITGATLVVVLIAIALWTEDRGSGQVVTASGGQQGLSAIQVSQVYVEGAFWAIVAIGTAIGVYVITRAED